MLNVVNTYAGCSPRNRVAAVCAGSLHYASASNIVQTDEFAVSDVIFLDANVNCLDSGFGCLVAGDVGGAGYVVAGDGAVSKIQLGENVQACTFLDEDTALFCTCDTLCLYNRRTNQETRHSTGFLINCVEADGGRVYVGDSTGGLHVYACAGARADLLERIEAHTDGVRDIKISERGCVATASQDTNIKLWEWRDGRLEHIQTLNGHADWVNGLRWAGSTLYSASSDKTIRVWEEKKTQNKNPDGCKHASLEVRSYFSAGILGGSSEFLGVCVLDGVPVGQYQTGGMDRFVEHATGCEYLLSGHLGEITDVDWCYNMLLTCSSDATSRIFYKGKETGRAQIHGYPLTSAKFLHGDKLRFISAAQETIMRVFECTQNFLHSCEDAADGCYEESSDCEEKIEISFEDGGSPRPGTLCAGDYVATSILAELHLTNEILHEFSHETLSENALASNVFREVQKIYGHFFEIKNIAVTRELIFSCNRSSSRNFAGLFVWDRDWKKIGYHPDHSLGIQRIKATDSAVITMGRDKTVCFYRIDGPRLALAKRLCDHERVVWDGGFSRDGRCFATCSRDCRVILYSSETFDILATRRFECEVTALDFSPVDELIAIGLHNGTVKVLDFSLDTKFDRRITGQRVCVARFNRSGRRLAVGGGDGLLRVLKMSQTAI